MSPEAAASHQAYAAYEKAQETMSREKAVKVFSEVYRRELDAADFDEDEQAMFLYGTGQR